MRFIVVWFFAFAALWGELTLYPAKSCEAFNNLKHTANRGDVHLDMQRTYTMLKHHKGQYLLKVPGATPSQRWVDDDCLTLRPLRGTPLYKQAHASSSSQTTMPQSTPPATTKVAPSAQAQPLLLALSWQNAFCEMHRNKAECKRSFFGAKTANRFTLHGLWPQPRDKVYCGVPKRLIRLDKRGQWSRLPEPNLSDATRRELHAVMPGVKSYLHRHEWIKHGTCYDGDAERYFTEAIRMTRQVNSSQLATLFQSRTGKYVTLEQVRFAVDRSFGKGSGKRVSLYCRKGMISEVWLHLYGKRGDGLSAMLKRAKPARSRCRGGIVDAPGYR